MQPTTVLIPEDLRVRLRDEAERRGVSVAELIRRVMARELGDASRAGGKRSRRKTPHTLPSDVFEYLAQPAGTYARAGRPGQKREPEDPYADVD